MPMPAVQKFGSPELRQRIANDVLDGKKRFCVGETRKARKVHTNTVNPIDKPTMRTPEPPIAPITLIPDPPLQLAYDLGLSYCR